MMSPAEVTRVDAYVRQSEQRDEDSISPGRQRERIEAWARARGIEISGWHEDINVSGALRTSPDERPGLAAALERIRQGRTQGVVVAYLSRLSRADNITDARLVIRAIEDAGGAFAAADLGVDPTTDGGELALNVMLTVNGQERRRLNRYRQEGISEALKRGVHVGKPPFGYRHSLTERGKRGPLEPSEDAPVVTEAFRRAADDGLEAARAYLLEAAPERSWSTADVRRFLANRVYVGELRHGDYRVVKTHKGGKVRRRRVRNDGPAFVLEGAHPALVDDDTFRLAQTAPRGRSDVQLYPAAGVAVCQACGGSLVGGGQRDGGRFMRCSNGARGKCPAPAWVSAENLERLCRWAAALVAEHAETGGEPSDELAAARAALERAKRELAAYMRATSVEDVGAEAFGAGARERGAKVKALARLNEALEDARPRRLVPPTEVLWLEGEELAAVLRDSFTRILVRRANRRQRSHEPVRERVRFETREGASGALVRALARRGETVRVASPELMEQARQRQLEAELAWAEEPGFEPRPDLERERAELREELRKLPPEELSAEGRLLAE